MSATPTLYWAASVSGCLDATMTFDALGEIHLPADDLDRSVEAFERARAQHHLGEPAAVAGDGCESVGSGPWLGRHTRRCGHFRSLRSVRSWAVDNIQTISHIAL